MLIKTAHQRYVSIHRANAIAAHLATLLPRNLRILDIGCGDGFLARLLLDRRPDLDVVGIDVLQRYETQIPVEVFDGKEIPFADRSFDCSMLIDVLHHTLTVRELLQEAIRVSKHSVVIKDHTAAGVFDRRILTFMDSVGNKRFGVPLPNNYLSRETWDKLFAELKLKPVETRTQLHLYPWFADWVFGRSLHFLTLLTVPSGDA